MSDNKGDKERRRHFRVKMDVELAIGPGRMSLLDDPAFALRMKHADTVDSLLEVHKAAEPVLAEAVDRGIEYLLALQDLLASRLEKLAFEEKQVSMTLDRREISLSEGGIGLTGEPFCDLGEERTAVIVARDHPSRRPIPARVRLVRIQVLGDRTYLGFEFVEMDPGVQRQLVEMLFRAQRKQIREARKR